MLPIYYWKVIFNMMTWKTVLPKMVALSQTRNSGDRITKFSWIESQPGNVCNHTPTSRDCNLLVSHHSVSQRATSGPCLLKGELNGLENLVILRSLITSVCTILPGLHQASAHHPSVTAPAVPKMPTRWTTTVQPHLICSLQPLLCTSPWHCWGTPDSRQSTN